MRWMPSDSAKLTPEGIRVFANLLCPGHATATGCGVCPEGSAPSGGGWDARAIYSGHFLSASSEDVLISVTGCEPHTAGMGGSFLLTRAAPSAHQSAPSAWRLVRYAAGTRASRCRKAGAKDGRDRLVCAEIDGHQGNSASWLFVLDPGRAEGSGDSRDVFFSVDDTTGSIDHSLFGGFTQRGDVDKVEFTDLQAKPQVRIVVLVRLGKALIPDNILVQVMNGTGKYPEIATVMRRYEFVWDGTDVIPDSKNPSMAAPITSYSIPK